ncbi:MAG: hypothetical protein K8T25_04680 [Planctomycetia bacterium]|nr:hypothetical protein [Planctomycetia bacterium]
MRSRSLLPLLLLCPLALGCGKAPLKLTFTEYQAPDSFSVLMPGTPEVKSDKVVSPVGGYDWTRYTVVNGPATFEVYVETFSDEYFQEVGTGLLNSATKGNRRSGKHEISNASSQFAGHPSVDYTVVDYVGQPPKVYQGRLIQIDKRIYDIAVEAPSGVVSAADVAKFLESFKPPAH